MSLQESNNFVKLFIIGNAKDRCPKGWRRFGCSCYYFSTRTVTWDVADVSMTLADVLSGGYWVKVDG